MKTTKRARVPAGLVVLFGLMQVSALPASAQGRKVALELAPATDYDVSPPLTMITPIPPSTGPRPIFPARRVPLRRRPSISLQADRALQLTAGPEPLSITPGLNFDGIGQGVFGFSPPGSPPDTNGAVGATQYVQWVNLSFAVFDKTTGALQYGPAAGNTIWTGFGGRCETQNNGDPIVLYDKAAGRWVFTQFVATAPYAECFAISTTSDATGPYYRYSFSYADFPDYPKLGVWPDAFYMSFVMFSAITGAYKGPKACAYNRTAMLAGNAASSICTVTGDLVSYDPMLPTDLDGTTAPPVGARNYFLNLDTNALDLWKFHVDWVTPANSTFTGTVIAVSPFAWACDNGACILQSQTKQRLDTLSDRPMFRLAYRNFVANHESLVVNHSIKVGNSGSAIRWYEIRDPGGSPSIYQQGTYAPDPATWRWMGSIAMDKVGNIAVGYSASSRTMHPAIRFAGRVPGDTAGTLSAETSIIEGTGSQASINRWGDYSAMTVDPVDDCTFWYTTEYLKANGSNNWNTRIASFKFSTCN